MTPHKHAVEIKAWADGAQIQYDVGLGWTDYTNEQPTPSWNNSDIKFRIKPNTIRYRNFLWTPSTAPLDRRVVCVCSEKDQQNEPRESWNGFIKWLGDWQEVEV